MPGPTLVPASSKRQFLVTIAGIACYWSALTGGGKVTTPERVFDGGNLNPYILTQPPTIDDIVVMRPYVVSRDDVLCATLQPQVGEWWTSLTEQPSDPNYVPGGTPTVWVALLTKVEPPQADANTAGAAFLTLTFSPTSAS